MLFRQYLLLCLLINLVYSVSKHPTLIVVSYDAFRYDFFNKKLTPNLLRLQKQGTYAEYLLNVFPTKTFPNHHSIATGLYPEVHGVVGNTYYDERLNKVQGISYEMFHYDDRVVPIWRLNEDVGEDRHSGSMMWPGGSYKYQGKNITYIKTFEAGFDWYKRVDMVISWITDPKQPANLVMLYFEEPDTHGHAFGPNSKVVKDLLVKLDKVTHYLEKQIEIHGLSNRVNVIHVSDHGMVATTPLRFINITQYLKNGTYEWAGASPAIQIIPHKGYEEDIYKTLKNASKTNGHFRVYKKQEFPDRWRYKNNKRAPPILVMAEEGYALDDLIEAAPKYASHYNFTLTNTSEFGVHGYDYRMPSMHPFFMARGPRIKKQQKVEPFHTVDLFNLFCGVLEIEPVPNNGSTMVLREILVDSHMKYTVGSILIVSVVGVLSALVLIVLAVIFTLVAIRRQQSLTTAAALNKRFPQTVQSNVIEARHLLEPEDA